jgi:hydrogenase nickel incorporation protein HypA/HybF
MHELAICQELMSQVLNVAAQNAATRVEKVVLSVGPLSGVEPGLLRRAFTVAQAGTLAAQAGLELRSSTARVSCHSCGTQSDAAPNRLVCGQCGDWKVKLVQGDELLLLSVELSGLADGSPALHASSPGMT